MKNGNFKIFGHLVFKRPNGYYYIELKRGKHITLKTKNEDIAKRLSLKLVQEILDNKIVSVEKKDNTTILDYLEVYIERRQDLDKDTLNLDRSAIKMLSRVVGNKKMGKLTIQDGEKFKNHYLNRNVSRFTIHTYFRHLNTFFKYAINDPELSFDKSPMPKNIKRPKRLPKFIKKEDRKILSDYFKKNNYEMLRIFQFALYTGLRREEIHDIEWSHFIPKEHELLAGILRVIGKGNKERVVPILKQAYFYMGQKKKSRVFKQWHVDTYTHYFKKGAVACNVKAHFHMTRHTAATQMIENGIPLTVVQKILGHADFTTTLHYVKVVDEIVEKEILKLSYTGAY